MIAKVQKNLILILMLVITHLSACVSVQIEPPKVEKHSQVEIHQTPTGFKPVYLPHVDRAWKSHSSGGVISYVTECSDDQLSLKEAQMSVLGQLEDFEIKDSQEIKVHSSPALSSTIEATTDGHSSYLRLVLFKKEKCLFIATLVTPPENYQKDLESFNLFLSGFEVK